jgi:hypothetical protein
MSRNTRKNRAAKGLCTECGKVPPARGKMCDECAEKNVEKVRAVGEKCLAAGLCVRCGKQPHLPGQRSALSMRAEAIGDTRKRKLRDCAAVEALPSREERTAVAASTKPKNVETLLLRKDCVDAGSESRRHAAHFYVTNAGKLAAIHTNGSPQMYSTLMAGKFVPAAAKQSLISSRSIMWTTTERLIVRD